MRSFIFNFNTPEKEVSWRVPLGCSLLLSALAFAGLEFFWRTQGHLPDVSDDTALWASKRKLASQEVNPVVLTGQSRMQLGISEKELKKSFPERDLIQLAVEDRAPMATVLDLCADPRFRGLILCDILPEGLTRRKRFEQLEWVRYARFQFDFSAALERKIKTVFQEQFVFLDSYLNLLHVTNQLLSEGRLPEPKYLVMDHDRFRSADFSRIHAARLKKNFLAEYRAYFRKQARLPPEAWLKEALEMEVFFAELHKRGGKLVFVYFPAGEETYRIENQAYPKNLYWDAWAKSTQASCLHFTDCPFWKELHTADGSHLDQSDAVRFTRWIREKISLEKIKDP